MDVKFLDKILCIFILFKVTIFIFLFTLICIFLCDDVYIANFIFVIISFIIELNILKKQLFDKKINKKIWKFKIKIFAKYKNELKNLKIAIIDYHNIEFEEINIDYLERYYQINACSLIIVALFMKNSRILCLEGNDDLKNIYFSFDEDIFFKQINEIINKLSRDNFKELCKLHQKEEKYNIIKQKITYYYDD